MPSLFREQDARYTPDAVAFDNEIHAAIRPILQRYFQMGYCPRELCYLVGQTANDITLCRILDSTPRAPNG